jgi:uncharacterized phage protein (TIGR02216 family)
VSSFGAGAARLYHAAATLLRWRPDEFWNATPAELALALQPPGDTGDVIDRTTIDELKRRFPDK